MNLVHRKIKEIGSDWELLLILAKRDISVRYKQTILGLSWAVVKPVATMLVFLFAYKQVAKVQDISGYPIQLVIFSGILFWNYFANSLQAISNSILVNSNLISKVYFPRLIICFSSIAVSLVDFLVGFIVYIILALSLHQSLSTYIILLPLALLITTLIALGFGLIFASFSVKYRDVQQIVPLIVQYGFFATPIVYTTKQLSEKSWFTLYNVLNPLAGIVEMFRTCLIDNYDLLTSQNIMISIAASILVFILGIIVFDKREDSFVDYL
ncbi:ABC transporter permease [Aquirufa rosea]|uniref:Transport permease protein n=1 Tax=Aquirufa rosea TaxID=2509241 RepID=A0A4Q1C267_9BACT|nr:ABC transporter permease [Aquirufa rosea]RXK52257.1 ABC transporter permease [Aquirufa rosea]